MIRKSSKKPVDAQEKTLFTDLVAPLFKDDKIDAALEEIERRKTLREEARRSREEANSQDSGLVS